MSHPTRVHALTVLLDRVASPRELAAELGEPINNVTYHIKQLVDLGCVELVEKKPAQGGRVVEHFYRGIERTYFDESDWELLDGSEKQLVETAIVSMISEDVTQAIVARTFSDPNDNHLSRTPLIVDQEGWSEIKAILGRALDELLEVPLRVAERGAPREETMPVKVEILQFRSPTPKRD